MLKFPLIVSVLTLPLVIGCASTDFAKTSASSTITEQRIKLESGPSHWGVNKLVQVGDTKLGFYGSRRTKGSGGHNGTTYTFDAGPTVIAAWYYDNQTGSHLANQTPVTKLRAELRPQGRYELRSVTKEGRLQFMLIDLDTNARIATSDWVRLSQQLLPEPAGESVGASVPGLFHHVR
ncbi:hypothetical protein RY831_04735 [Noviherbaspirillum sp. CPCC 100848]|uniref:DUF2846 domain-containing protein n=1 Tax=Noviherbaspirillum album TaxID=3080276 RepID=A0ABU6J4J2_9BURK|nr:hypothetical protein [Noviherbaspirillum sp. CPCC 100848]MEC4718440.1 hypothetical protein [Noviherbaspirillum sp. CPCC 100848]